MDNQFPEEIPVMLYFYNDLCAPCKALRPKVELMLKEEFTEMKLIKINTAENPEFAAKYLVFSAPTLLVFFEGKEYIRESKNISIIELHDKVKRLYNMLY